jgi:CTP synthase
MMSDSPYPVIDLMPNQKTVTDKGGTMRLGAYTCQITPNSLAHQIYQKTEIRERHRHRYELNNEFRQDLERAGLKASGINPETQLVEIVELDTQTHPFFIGVQYHPELKSTVASPHPLFSAFVKAALQSKQQLREK